MSKVAIGIDMGHGEIAAHYMSSNGISPCWLSEDNSERTLISVIGYQEDGSVKLGRAALRCAECYSYFKASPVDWDESMPDDPRHRTRKQLMEDCLRQLMKQIRALNPDLREMMRQSEKDVLLLVGCPASADWTQEKHRKAYEELVSRATGIRIQNVRVVPESRAAIFSAFNLNKKIQIDTTKGVMVFDFGSLTADCTYILLGQKQEEHSWTLGASRIEQNLAHIPMAQLDAQQFFSEDIYRMPLWVRSDKEAYFNDMTDKVCSLDLRKCRQNQQTGKEEPIPLGLDNLNGKMCYESATVHIPINSETMAYCVFGKKIPGFNDEMTFCVKKDGIQDRIQTNWYTHCRSFFQEMKQKLKDQNLPCGTVVLTGGASKMHFVQQLWEETFPEVPKSNMVLEKVPAFSVSIGLCYLGNAWIRSDEVYNAVLYGMRQDVQASIVRQLDEICSRAAEYAYKLVYRQVEGAGMFQMSSVGALSAEIQRSFENDPIFGNLILDGLSNKLSLETIQIQQTAVRRVVSQLYPGLEGMIQPMGNQEYMKTLHRMFDDNQFGGYIGTAVRQKLLEAIDEITRELIAVVLVCVISIVLGPIGWIGGLIAGSALSDAVKSMISRNSGTPCSLFAIAISLRNKRESYQQDYEKSIRSCIEAILQADNCMGKNYGLYLEQLETESRHMAAVLSLQQFS